MEGGKKAVFSSTTSLIGFLPLCFFPPLTIFSDSSVECLPFFIF